MRLIDADELKKHIRRCDDSATRATFDYVHEDDIDDMPTVCDIEDIKAEIYKERTNISFNLSEEKSKWVNSGIYDGLVWAEEIIDKYTAERR